MKQVRNFKQLYSVTNSQIKDFAVETSELIIMYRMPGEPPSDRKNSSIFNYVPWFLKLYYLERNVPLFYPTTPMIMGTLLFHFLTVHFPSMPGFKSDIPNAYLSFLLCREV